MCFSLCLYECVCLCDLFVSVYVICLSVCVCLCDVFFSVCVCNPFFSVCDVFFSVCVCVCLSDLFFSGRLSVCVVCLCVVLLVFVVYTHALHEYLMYLHRQPHTVCPVTFTLTS